LFPSFIPLVLFCLFSFLLSIILPSFPSFFHSFIHHSFPSFFIISFTSSICSLFVSLFSSFLVFTVVSFWLLYYLFIHRSFPSFFTHFHDLLFHLSSHLCFLPFFLSLLLPVFPFVFIISFIHHSLSSFFLHLSLLFVLPFSPSFFFETTLYAPFALTAWSERPIRQSCPSVCFTGREK
jgi:hypothetical protein